MKTLLSLFSLIALMFFSNASAYKLSEMADLKEAEKLCMQKSIPLACAKAVDLFENVYLFHFQTKIYLNTYGDLPITVSRHRYHEKYYQQGCHLGDKVQCFHYKRSLAETRYAKGFSTLREGYNRLGIFRRPIRPELRKLEEKYLDHSKTISLWKKLVNQPLSVIKIQKKAPSSKPKKKETENLKLSRYLGAYFHYNPENYKRFKSLPKSQQRKIADSLKGGKSRVQVYDILERATKYPSRSVRPSSPLRHSHAGRKHSHKLPPQGRAHRHGSGAIGR